MTLNRSSLFLAALALFRAAGAAQNSPAPLPTVAQDSPTPLPESDAGAARDDADRAPLRSADTAAGGRRRRDNTAAIARPPPRPRETSRRRVPGDAVDACRDADDAC